MNVSGTLHFYSGKHKEFFFVFDDIVAQRLNKDVRFDVDDPETRKVYISVGSSRFIHKRTLNFSRKQTEIKVSLCSRNTKDGLRALTDLYDWFARRGDSPSPIGVLGNLAITTHQGDTVWELKLTEPEGLVAPPGFGRRKKKKSNERKSFEHRREIQQKDLLKPGRLAEKLALNILNKKRSASNLSYLWRDKYLDSEKIEIRKLGIIADIDVWNEDASAPESFIEVKAQKIVEKRANPLFYLSSSEWRSYQKCKSKGLKYEIWLFQYREIDDLDGAGQNASLTLFDILSEKWLAPEGYIVMPPSSAGTRTKIPK